MNVDLDESTREAVLNHVLSSVHPDRLEAEIVATAPRGDDVRVGVKVQPRGYVSTAKYALVTVEDGEIVDAKACTGGELRTAVGRG